MMGAASEPVRPLTARERATAYAARQIVDYEAVIGNRDAVRHLIAIAYLDGEQAGADATIRILRAELSQL